MSSINHPHPATSYILTMWYLAIPLILWLFGWITPALSLPLIALLLWVLIDQSRSMGKISRHGLNIPGILIFTALAGLMVFSLGIDGRVNQTFDFLARNAIYSDLINRPWPTEYPDGRILLYPSHFWLLPAMASRLLPQAAPLFLQIWCGLGFLILLLNLHSTLGTMRTVAATGAILFLCSLTTLADTILNTAFYIDAVYGVSLCMPANLSQFFNTFHYFLIVSLCLSAMVDKELPWRSFVTFSVLMAALHPLCAASILPWVLGRAYHEWSQQRAQGIPLLRSLRATLLIRETVIGGITVLVSFLYYSSGDSNACQPVFLAPYGPGLNTRGLLLYASAIALHVVPLLLAYKVSKFPPLLFLAGILPVIQLCRFGCDNGINEWTYKTVCVWTFLLAYSLSSVLHKRSAQCLLLVLLLLSAVPVGRQLVKDKKIVEAAKTGFRYNADNVRDDNHGSMVNAEQGDYLQHTAPGYKIPWIFKSAKP